jgi:hypothetical protein
VMESAFACGTDIHAWSLADCLETLENRDRPGVVGQGRLPLVGTRAARIRAL